MGKLSIIGTPIGNLEDITLRALRTLKEADVILCEDTRVTSKLLARHEIKKPLLSYHQHSRLSKIDQILALLEEGKHLALVSDAGTPSISDPGTQLVEAVRKELPEVFVEAIPGPSALTAALSVAGLPADDFVFLGFLPHKKGRQTALNKIAESKTATVLYESPHRIAKLMKELVARVPDRRVAVCRELTKKFEQTAVGTVLEIEKRIGKDIPARGEFVVVITP